MEQSLFYKHGLASLPSVGRVIGGAVADTSVVDFDANCWNVGRMHLV